MKTRPASAVDTRDMLVVHTAIRREYRLAPALVRAVAPGDTARARQVGDHLEMVDGLLHHHHTGEDRLLWPKLLQRVPAEVAPVVNLMEQQHQQIHDTTTEAAAVRARWVAAAGSADRDGLAACLDRLHAGLTEHLAAEEEHVLPLAERCLAAAEWRQLGEEGMAGLPRRQLPLVFGTLMYEGDPQVLSMMLSHAPRLPRLVLPVIAPRVFARYSRRVHGTATP